MKLSKMKTKNTSNDYKNSKEINSMEMKKLQTMYYLIIVIILTLIYSF